MATARKVNCDKFHKHNYLNRNLIICATVQRSINDVIVYVCAEQYNFTSRWEYSVEKPGGKWKVRRSDRWVNDFSGLS